MEQKYRLSDPKTLATHADYSKCGPLGLILTLLEASGSPDLTTLESKNTTIDPDPHTMTLLGMWNAIVSSTIPVHTTVFEAIPSNIWVCLLLLRGVCPVKSTRILTLIL